MFIIVETVQPDCFKGHSVVSDKEAKVLLKGNDELILAVYDYWIDKRLRLKQSLIPTVKSDKRDLVNKKVILTPKISSLVESWVKPEFD